jgi:hypothetical protein
VRHGAKGREKSLQQVAAETLPAQEHRRQAKQIAVKVGADTTGESSFEHETGTPQASSAGGSPPGAVEAGEPPAQLLQLGRVVNHDVRLMRVLHQVVLVIVLRLIEAVERGQLRHDRA